MKLFRFGESGRERPGVIYGEKALDLSAIIKDYDREFFRTDGLSSLDTILRISAKSLPIVPANFRYGPCIARPGKVVCIGLNYKDHAAETGSKIPEEPIVFLKASNAMVGPHDNIIIPRNSKHTDWEVELGIIMGKDARYLASPESANDYIAGYCISHDVSERHYQKERGGQWTKGKSCDNFNPVGPWLVTKDELPNVYELGLKLSVNGKQMQCGNTRDMIFNVHVLVYYLSQFMTLEAGDLISTGTPAGVGMGMKPPCYLTAGDIVELSIDGLGSQRSVCVSAK